MDPRLEEACHAGDVGALHRLLQEDRLLLHRLTTTPNSTTDSPLHIAALLGHADLAREVLARNPQLAQEVNAQGLSALHLAAANGHLPVVRELIGTIGADLCLVRDKEGLVPTHTAAMKGRMDVLKELTNACPESLRVLTSQGDSILHLVVKANCSQALSFLAETLHDGDELWNCKDEKGNTILHLAVARKQLQIIKFLLGKQEIDVNVVNLKGSTPLDVLLESPSEHGDLVLGEMIRAAGGKTAGENGPQLLEKDESVGRVNPIAPPTTETNWRNRLSQGRSYSRLPKVEGPNPRPKKEDEYNPDTLMMVAALIATITFQAGLNPPGGSVQSDSSSSTQPGTTNSPSNDDKYPGAAVLASQLGAFMVFNMVGLFASLSTILLLICLAPRKNKKLMRILVWTLWFAVFATAFAFSVAVGTIFPYTSAGFTMNLILLRGWFLVLTVFFWWVCVRFIIYMLRKVRWWKRKRAEKNVPRRVSYLFLKRIAVSVVTVVIVFTIAFVIWGDYEVFQSLSEEES